MLNIFLIFHISILPVWFQINKFKIMHFTWQHNLFFFFFHLRIGYFNKQKYAKQRRFKSNIDVRTSGVFFVGMPKKPPSNCIADSRGIKRKIEVVNCTLGLSSKIKFSKTSSNIDFLNVIFCKLFVREL